MFLIVFNKTNEEERREEKSKHRDEKRRDETQTKHKKRKRTEKRREETITELENIKKGRSRGGPSIYISIYSREPGSGVLGFRIFGCLGVSAWKFEVLRPRIVENSRESGFQGLPLGPGGRNASS